MKKNTARIALGLAFFMLFQLPLSLALTPISTTTSDFKDVPATHPNYKAIMDLKKRGVISGYPDGTFKPNQVVNRVEALKIILLGSKINTATSTKTANFNDISAQEWYAPYLNKAVELKFVQGYPDGSFKPTQTVNLVENLKMLLLAKNVDLSKITVNENPYADAFKDQWYAKYVQYAKEKLIIEGDKDNKVYPSQGMTRAKLSETMYRLIYLQEQQLDWFPPTNTVPPTTDGNPSPTGSDNPQSANSMNITIENSKFSMPEMTIAIGTTVTWTNKESASHTVTSDDGSYLNSPTLTNGQTYIKTFDKEGTYEYYCEYHPTMKGKIIVKPAIQVPTI
jgi:amicyanin